MHWIAAVSLTTLLHGLCLLHLKLPINLQPNNIDLPILRAVWVKQLKEYPKEVLNPLEHAKAITEKTLNIATREVLM